ncbi:MAG: alpha/beta hydrolase [Sandaracinaceae bacterium]|nr:alpha/beta hydrolase [Myxococcales bacterium]MCB9660713.1 alpha/beta hydrolase [Sandaracinaceae bacterium]
MTDSAPPSPEDTVVTGAPQTRYVDANGIRHHVLEWAPARHVPARGETVVLCHGFLDFAYSYVRVAVPLAARGYRVLAFDWRGHGRSGWVGAGGYYHFPDYVQDLDRLLPQLVTEGEPVHLVGHSMGATACAMFAGVRSERLRSVALLEGLGPPSAPLDSAPDRYKSWLTSCARVADKPTTVIVDLDDALRRMRVQNSQLSGAFGRFLAMHATKACADGTDGLTWRFDPLHRTLSPLPFRAEMFVAFLARIRAPALVMLGEKGFRLADEAARLAALHEPTVHEVPGTGHMLHWFAAEEVCGALAAHFERAASRAR